MTQGTIIDAPTCAALLRCSQSHLHRLARKRVVPGTKIGRGWVFVEEDILAWLRERTMKVEIVARKRGRPRKPIPI